MAGAVCGRRGGGIGSDGAAIWRWKVMHISAENCCKKKSGVYKSNV